LRFLKKHLRFLKKHLRFHPETHDEGEQRYRELRNFWGILLNLKTLCSQKSKIHAMNNKATQQGIKAGDEYKV
jgi:hypothetical protein